MRNILHIEPGRRDSKDEYGKTVYKLVKELADRVYTASGADIVEDAINNGIIIRIDKYPTAKKEPRQRSFPLTDRILSGVDRKRLRPGIVILA